MRVASCPARAAVRHKDRRHIGRSEGDFLWWFAGMCSWQAARLSKQGSLMGPIQFWILSLYTNRRRKSREKYSNPRLEPPTHEKFTTPEPEPALPSPGARSERLPR